MKNLTIILFLFASLLTYGQQEKRLALVIGNANYDKGALKNPVNDAELVAKTLDSLDFDVILKTDLEYRSDFIRAVREFGQKRTEYDAAFVYYAGHGIQVDSKNFLLPTKQEFLSEDDVLDYGVSVQNILRYLESESEKVNVLILDACRDNPFEVSWDVTRSLKGSGLAKIPPPTGSLIAFSTDAGKTAADGQNNNSIYCESLVKNMLKENITLDQVFRNVRTDVLKASSGRQRPVEASQLTGTAFYMKRSNFEKEFEFVASLFVWNPYFNETDQTPLYYEALEKLNKILAIDSMNARAYYWLSNVYEALGQLDESLLRIQKAIKIDSTDAYFYSQRSNIYNELDSGNDSLINLAILDDQKAITLDPDNIDHFYAEISLFIKQDKYEEGIKSIEKALLIHPNDGELFRQKANMHVYLLQNKLALESYTNAIASDPKNGFYYMQKGDFLAGELEKYEEALELFKKANQLKPDEPSPYFSMLYSYFALNKLDSVIDLCNKLIALDVQDPEPYFHISNYYYLNQQYVNAITYLSLAIFKKLENPDYYIQDFQGYTVYLSDLYFKRYELYAELEIDILSCNDLRKTVNILSEILDYSDDELSEKFWDEKDVFKNKHEKANRLALKNCK